MGLSLRNIGKKIEDVLGGVANVAGGVERQVNPFDNNATYKNPNPAPIVRPSLIQQGEQLLAPTVQGSLGLVGAAKNVGMILPNDARALLGIATHNDAATQSALNQAGQGVGTVGATLQAVPQLGARLVLSGNPFTRPGIGKETYHPNSGVEKAIFGNQPIQSYGTQFMTNKKQSGTASALGQSIATVSGDIGTAALLNQAGGKFADAKAAKAAENSNWSNNKAYVVNEGSRAKVGESGYVPEKGVKGGIAVNNSAAKYNPLKDERGSVMIPGKDPLAEVANREGTYSNSAGGKINVKFSDDGHTFTLTKDLVGADGKVVAKAGADNIGGTPLLTNPEDLAAGKIQLTKGSILNNERGSIPLGSDKPTAAELSEGKSLGMSKAEVTKAKADMNDATANLQKPQGTVGEVKQGNKVALKKSLGNEKASAEINTAKNPIKVNIGKVEAGDYAKARSNGQLASKVVEFKGSQLLNSMQKLSTDERANFWKSVEHPPADASPALQTAIGRWRDVANQAHATSQALGGNTNYIANYARHPWDLSGWDEANQGPKMGSGTFSGLDSMNRIHGTIAEGEQAGLKLSNDPLAEAQNYIKASSSTLRKQALMKGLQEADKGQPAVNTADFGYGKTIQLSDQGLQEAKGVLPSTPTDNPLVQGYRAVNRQAKGTLLSASQFHPINVAGLRAAPGLALEGHPILAAQGLYDTFRSAFGNKYSDNLLQQAANDGTVEKAARIGMPIGSSDYSADGTLSGGPIGEHTVFGKQLPAMHYAVAKGIISDLQDKGISLDSPEARDAGLTGNKMMGFVNQEVQNLDPRVQRGMADTFLAPQFTRSKFQLMGDAATKGGVAGGYARATVAGNVAATTALLAGVSYASHQQSDNAKDLLLRALVDPAAPTNATDNKGNSVSLKTPATFTSEVAKLIGMKLVRGQDGHLGVSWKPQNIPSTVEDWMRSRLAIVPGNVVKVLTNTSYAGKPLYDPNASLGTQIAQGATTVGTGLLPIGLQGLPYTQAVKEHLPSSVQGVLNAGTPGTNPLLKSLASSVGLTPQTDKTVGKGQQTTQYFDALDTAKKGLDRRSADAFDLITGSKKNPVTGVYDVSPTAYDAPTKANALLQNPTALQHLTTLNQQLKTQGQQIDPFYDLTPDQQTKALQIQRLDPQNPDKAQLIKQAGDWYTQLGKDQSAFFSTLPAGDPNKPKSPVQYQSPSPQDQALADKYYSLTDSAQKSAFIKANPNIQNVFDATAQYDKALRAARGLPQLKDYPQASPAVQKLLDQYDTLDKAGRSALGKAHPEIYNYFQQVSQYNLPRQVAPSQYVGNNLTPQAVKTISSLGNDIYYNGGLQGSQGLIAPTGGTGQPAASSSSGGSTHRRKPYGKTISFKKGGSVSIKSPKVAIKKASTRLASNRGVKVKLSKSLA